MASETIYLTGTGKWVKVLPDYIDNNEDFHGPGGAATLDLYMEKEELDKFAATGSRLRVKTGEDGAFVSFKRKMENASIPAFGGLPQVVDAEGNDWDGSRIGNGSTLQIAVTVYDSKMGKGTRLEGVKVLELEEMPEFDEDAAPKLPF